MKNSKTESRCISSYVSVDAAVSCLKCNWPRSCSYRFASTCTALAVELLLFFSRTSRCRPTYFEVGVAYVNFLYGVDAAKIAGHVRPTRFISNSFIDLHPRSVYVYEPPVCFSSEARVAQLNRRKIDIKLLATDKVSTLRPVRPTVQTPVPTGIYRRTPVPTHLKTFLFGLSYS